MSSVGLGVQNMSRTYQTTIPSRPEMLKIIRAAFDQGVTFFDAAEAYGPHEVERILGEGVAPFRDKVVIATKFGFDIDPDTGARRAGGLNSRPDHVKAVVDAMLRRLRTDRIDLLYQHRVDPQVPIEDVAGAIKELVTAGKVRHWGLSEMGPNTLRRAHAALPVSAVQSEYSMLWRGPEEQILPICEELGIGFVPWSPLGVGFLTGAIDARTGYADGDIRKAETRFSRENVTRNLALVDVVKTWAARKQATPGQIAVTQRHDAGGTRNRHQRHRPTPTGPPRRTREDGEVSAEHGDRGAHVPAGTGAVLPRRWVGEGPGRWDQHGVGEGLNRKADATSAAESVGVLGHGRHVAGRSVRGDELLPCRQRPQSHQHSDRNQQRR